MTKISSDEDDSAVQADQGWRRLSLSQWILVGMLLGIVCGLFFGEACAQLNIFGDAFIKLLQMSILPYIVVSLIANIGALKPIEAKTLAGKTGVILLAFWLVGLVLIWGLQYALPAFTNAAFFSTSWVTEPEKVDFLALYIPANPFNSLANNIVPAAVLFSISLGIALIGIEQKDGLIGQLNILSKALVRVTNFVSKLTPIGVFAISASAAGTLTPVELERIQAYLILYAVGGLLLTFWILPMIVSSLTPFKYADVLRHAKDGLVIAFTTANVFIALPLLIEGARRLFEQYEWETDKSLRHYEIVLPIVFSFPNLGKLMMLVFIPFAAWFSGDPLSLAHFPTFSISGFLTFFGSVTVAIPFLLDLFRIPADLFDLFMVTSILISRLASIGAVMHLVGVSLLATAFFCNRQIVRKSRISFTLITTVAIVFGAVAGTRAYLAKVLTNSYTKDQVIAKMQTLADPSAAIVHRQQRELAPGGPPEAGMESILKRGIIRVGFVEKRIPWSYFNQNGDLVGLDVDLAHRLAKELGVGLEFIPVTLNRWHEEILLRQYDVMMPGMPVTAESLARIPHSDPVWNVTLCFVVPDYMRQEFGDIEEIRRMDGLRIGCPTLRNPILKYYASRLSERFPKAEIIVIDGPEDYFRQTVPLDTIFMSAEGGSAWCLLYPEFNVVIPSQRFVTIPIAYPAADEDIADFLSQWLELKRQDETLDKLRDHWIYGKDAEIPKPRWSIIRNVLHWVD